MFKDSQAAENAIHGQLKLWQIFSKLWPSCQQTRDPWKVIQELNMRQIADNGKGMMIIWNVTAYLGSSERTLESARSLVVGRAPLRQVQADN